MAIVPYSSTPSSRHSRKVISPKSLRLMVAAEPLSCCAPYSQWKPIVRGHVIKLCGRLVVPTAPGRSAVHTDYRALITRQRNNLSIVAINPNALIVVAARRTFPSHKSLPTVCRFPSRGILDVHDIRIVRRDCNPHRTRSASADPVIVIHLCPCFSGIV